MHAVEHYELIRRKHFVDEMSQRAIAEELGHSRKFVKKAIEHPVPPGYRLTKTKPKPTLDPVRPLIDAWLEEDLSRPVKQRHTAQRIYERLPDGKLRSRFSPCQLFPSASKTPGSSPSFPRAFLTSRIFPTRQHLR